MAKMKKVVKNLKKKLTKEELEELALQDQISDTVLQADASPIAIDTSSMSKKIVKIAKKGKKLTKEELEELALQDQINDVVAQADAEAYAVDTSSLPHFAGGDIGIGVAGATSNDTGGTVLTTESYTVGAGAGAGLSAGAMLAIGALAIGGIAVAASGGGWYATTFGYYTPYFRL